MSPHTPGPWTALDTTKSTFGMGSVVAALGQTTDGLHWCVVSVGERVRDGELGTNAYLIAAAPEMLQALYEAEWSGGGVVPFCPVCGFSRHRGHTNHCPISTAIAKAEGRAT